MDGGATQHHGPYSIPNTYPTTPERNPTHRPLHSELGTHSTILAHGFDSVAKNSLAA
jgi:hypothetical protein